VRALIDLSLLPVLEMVRMSLTDHLSISSLMPGRRQLRWRAMVQAAAACGLWPLLVARPASLSTSGTSRRAGIRRSRDFAGSALGALSGVLAVALLRRRDRSPALAKIT